MSARGFALLEWLVASALVLAIAGAVFAAVLPARSVIERTQVRGDMALAARAALEIIVRELREAGSGAAIDDGGTPLAALLTPVILLEDLGAGPALASGRALTIRRTPMPAAQGRLVSAALAGDALLRLDTASRCATGAPACGFASGDLVSISDGMAADSIRIADVLHEAVTLSAGVPRAYPAGAVVSRLEQTTFGWRREGGAGRLVRITDAGAEQPLLDQVVAFEISPQATASPAEHFALRLRIQVPADHLRGPAGFLFVQAGTAPGPRQWVPDVELRAEVALRNAGGVP